jgi:putative NADH-flavin reductase
MENKDIRNNGKMKIAILGSSGFVGKVLIHKAIESGFTIKTLTRSPEKLEDIKDKVEIIEGSVFDPAAVEETLKGVQVVLSTIGPPARKPGNPLLYEKAMKDIVSIMKKHEIKRYIHIGGAVHEGGENEQWPINRRLLRLFLNLVGKPILTAKHLEWEVLKSSGLEWTLVRPPRIVKGKSTGLLAKDEKNLHGMETDVDDLTGFMLEQIYSKEWIKKAPLVASVRK